QKAVQHFVERRFARDLREMVAAAEQRAVPDEQHGNAGNAGFRSRGNHIQVAYVLARYELFRFHFLDAGNLVAVARGQLVVTVLRRALHPLHEAVDHAAVLALEEQDGRIDVALVVLAPDQPDAGCRAAPDLVLQAGPRAIAEIAVLAIADQEQLLQLVDGFAHRPGVRVRPEVAALARTRAPVKL